ncbi:MAG: hypothetical protein EBV19_09395, partial [Flavobacteriia bacterium]|nr:hypothetical protein [Flavobacteriia bacterium]
EYDYPSGKARAENFPFLTSFRLIKSHFLAKITLNDQFPLSDPSQENEPLPVNFEILDSCGGINT